MYTIHEVRRLRAEASSYFTKATVLAVSISELSLSYSSSLFYGNIGAEGVSDADSQSGEIEPYCYPTVCSNSPSSYASP